MPISEEIKHIIDEAVKFQLGQELEIDHLREMVFTQANRGREDDFSKDELNAYLSQERIQEIGRIKADSEFEDARPVETKIQGTPTKRVINTRAKQMTLAYALAEFIDNSIESWESTGQDSRLNVKVTFANVESITISDDAAGMTSSVLQSAISPGSSLWARSGFSTGRFGEGLKIGVAHLGTGCKLVTICRQDENLARSQIEWGGEQNPCEDPSICDHDGCYYDDNNRHWEKTIQTRFKPYLHDYINNTGTTIEITHLNPSTIGIITSPVKYAEMLTELLRLYSTKIRNSDGNLSIHIENSAFCDGFVDSVKLEDYTTSNTDFKSYNEEDLADAFYKLPGVLHPSKHELILDYPDNEVKLKVEVVTGIRRGEWNGVTIWANSRLMEWRSKNITQPTSGRGYHSYKYDRGDRNLLAFVNITCEDSSKIPWRGPMKKGLHIDPDNEESEGLIIAKFIGWTMLRYNKYRTELSTQRLDARDTDDSLGANLSSLLSATTDLDCDDAEKIITPVDWSDAEVYTKLDTFFNCLIKRHYPEDFIIEDALESSTGNALAVMKNKYKLGEQQNDTANQINQVMKLRSNQNQREKVSLGMMFSALEPMAFFELEEEE